MAKNMARGRINIENINMVADRGPKNPIIKVLIPKVIRTQIITQFFKNLPLKLATIKCLSKERTRVEHKVTLD
jgi:hypothetical protein